MRNRDLRPAAKANPTIQQAFERFQYNKADGHAEKSLPSYTCARQWLQQYGYDLQKKRATSGELRNKNVWWVTKQ